ncbi:helix-turn-helix transcriptional regulator [Citreimonas salinaria]|uniref:helix-turn-helix transcriptional regulator n=1 Tax=Citreimonas salinaria TaxID=321339 RepID=UPI000B7EE5D7|nr:AlpA family transcriptional regulator [Citreimonas salinaria]
MIDRILRRPEVEEAVGLSRATLYRMIERGDFPRPTKLGERAVGWRESAVEVWLHRRSLETNASEGK